MKNYKPIPKTDIEVFKDPSKYSILYLEIIEILEKENIFKDRFENILDFLNFFEEKYLFVFNNVNRPEYVIEHLLELDLSKKQLFFLVRYLIFISKKIDFYIFLPTSSFRNGIDYINDNLYLKLREQLKIGQVLSDSENMKNADIPSQQLENDTEGITPTFINNFDTINPIEIYKHFKSGLVEKGYLTEIQLNDYLKKAFELNEIPEKRFKFNKAPQKGRIIKVFYNYYKDVAYKDHGKQKQYASLLGEYFEGYKTSNIITNFSKD